MNKLFLTSIIVGLVVFSSIVIADQKEYKITPNTIGIGLQQSYASSTYESSDTEHCIPYHLGNPWATNLTAWIVVSGDLENYYTRNDPEKIFVPSGTFRYNSSCCLLKMDVCFKFPYAFENTKISGKVSSKYVQSEEHVVTAVGSAVGSSVAYTLDIIITPASFIEIGAGKTKCVEFFDYGEACFKAPLIVFSDTLKNQTLENGQTVTLKYKNNRMLIIIAIVSFVVILLICIGVIKSRSKSKETKDTSQTDASQPAQIDSTDNQIESQ